MSSGSERLYEAFSDIREDFIDEARFYTRTPARVRKSAQWYGFAAAAAVVLIVGIGVFAISSGRDNAADDGIGGALNNSFDNSPRPPGERPASGSDSDALSDTAAARSDSEHSRNTLPPSFSEPAEPGFDDTCERDCEYPDCDCPDCGCDCEDCDESVDN
jgi:hypothetical protein